MKGKFKIVINSQAVICFVALMFAATLLGMITGGASTRYGSASVVKVILITAVVTALINYVFFPSVALCGASGVVFAFIILMSFTGFKEGEIPLTFILIAVIFIGQQIYEGIFIKDDISQLSHIVGGIVGGVIGYKWNRKT